jgi:O-antigen ligase/predicted Zn-dependent protease
MRSTRGAAVTLIGVVVLGDALFRGGVDAAALWPSAVIAGAILLLAPGRSDRRALVSPLALALGMAVAFVGLQLVPLPPALLGLLSPGASAVLRGASSVSQRELGWRPVSLHPAETARELATAATLAMLAAASATLAATPKYRTRLLRVLALSGIVLSSVQLAAALLGVAPVIEPRVTFVNPNHLAGFLLLTSFPALGFGLRARGPERVAWLVGFGFTGGEVLLSLSRAGIAAFFVGAGVFALLRARNDAESPAGHASSPPTRRRTAIAAIGVFSALAVAAFLAVEPILGELGTLRHASSDVKLSVFADTLGMIRAFPLVGVGRGAFSNVYPAYKSDPARLTFTHAENEWLQLPVELGVPAGVALIAAFAWAFAAAARRRDLSDPLAGALAGAAALVAQSFFDFSLEILGVAAPFAVVLGIASQSQARARLVRSSFLRVAAGVGLGLAIGALVMHRLHADEVAAIVSAESADEAIPRARAALRWHPADYVIPAAVGQLLASKDRCAEAAPWLAGAMLRNPTAPEPHHAMAVCLARSRREALAAQEFRLAFSYGDASALAEAARWYRAPGALLAMAPDTPEGLTAVGALLRSRPAEAREAWQRAWSSFGDLHALAELAFVELELGDVEEALRLGRLLEMARPPSDLGFLAAQRALDRLDRPDEALHELELGVARHPGSEPLLVALGERQLKDRQFSAARATFERIVARDTASMVRKRIWISRALEGQGRLREALDTIADARQLSPYDVGVLEVFSSLSAAVGRYEDAIDALELALNCPNARRELYERELARLRAAAFDHRRRQALEDSR